MSEPRLEWRIYPQEDEDGNPVEGAFTEFGVCELDGFSFRFEIMEEAIPDSASKFSASARISKDEKLGATLYPRERSPDFDNYLQALFWCEAILENRHTFVVKDFSVRAGLFICLDQFTGGTGIAEMFKRYADKGYRG